MAKRGDHSVGSAREQDFRKKNSKMRTLYLSYHFIITLGPNILWFELTLWVWERKRPVLFFFGSVGHQLLRNSNTLGTTRACETNPLPAYLRIIKHHSSLVFEEIGWIWLNYVSIPSLQTKNMSKCATEVSLRKWEDKNTSIQKVFFQNLTEVGWNLKNSLSEIFFGYQASFNLLISQPYFPPTPPTTY